MNFFLENIYYHQIEKKSTAISGLVSIFPEGERVEEQHLGGENHHLFVGGHDPLDGICSWSQEVAGGGEGLCSLTHQHVGLPIRSLCRGEHKHRQVASWEQVQLWSWRTGLTTEVESGLYNPLYDWYHAVCVCMSMSVWRRECEKEGREVGEAQVPPSYNSSMQAWVKKGNRKKKNSSST